MQPLDLRLSRLERTVPYAAKVKEIIKDRHDAITQTADRGIPPAAAISEAIFAEVPVEIRQTISFRQFVGIALQSALQSLGYRRQHHGVRMRGDKVFSTGSTYCKVEEDTAIVNRSLLYRFVECLTREERQELLRILKTLGHHV